MSYGLQSEAVPDVVQLLQLRAVQTRVVASHVTKVVEFSQKPTLLMTASCGQRCPTFPPVKSHTNFFPSVLWVQPEAPKQGYLVSVPTSQSSTPSAPSHWPLFSGWHAEPSLRHALNIDTATTPTTSRMFVIRGTYSAGRGVLNNG